MKKIPTLFLRDETDRRYVTREPNPACRWVFDGVGTATWKYDGTCVMLDDAGQWWARRTVKPDQSAPATFVPVETDTTTGIVVGWTPIKQSAFAKFHAEAVANLEHSGDFWRPGTYELVGPKVNGNPEDAKRHELWEHASAQTFDAPRDYDGLAAFLAGFMGEGIVWHHVDGRMAKLKKRDFRAGVTA